MNNLKVNEFYVIGISVRTTNENGQSGKDIQALWGRFMSERIAAKIPNKVDEAIYSIYTEYEKDHTLPYTTVIGCKVKSMDSIPEGLIGKTVNGGSYQKRCVKGNLMKGIVYEEWVKIWKSNIPRAFTSDFEVYGENANNPEDAEVEIYVSIK